MEGLWLMVVPVISTSHLTVNSFDVAVSLDICRLTKPAGLNDIQGCIICVEDQDPSAFNDCPELQTIIIEFDKLGYYYVRFDPDGDVIDGLPTFNW